MSETPGHVGFAHGSFPEMIRLRRRGVVAVFVRYPREGHGATEPAHQLEQLERTVAWFDRFLQPKRSPERS